MALVDGCFSGFLSLCILTDSKHFEIKRPPTHSARRPVLGLIDGGFSGFLSLCMHEHFEIKSPRVTTQQRCLYSTRTRRTGRLD